LMLMNSEDHYGMTDVEWDPTGRFVTTSASVWTHQVSLISCSLCEPSTDKS